MEKKENKICQSCNTSFVIEQNHFSFYEKIGVLPPNKCPDCRQQIRYAFRNERRLYRRNCDLCDKSTVTIYSPDKPFKIYCTSCFWGDEWDAKVYAQDFDFSRPFFEQFYELLLKSPRIALLNKNTVNSEYTNHAGDNKDCYLSFCMFNCENMLYCTNTWEKGRDCMDCQYNPMNISLCYECVDGENLYNCQYTKFLRDCSDCFYSYDCRNCSNCFMCYNLRNKSYCIENQQHTKENYKKIIEEMNLRSRTKRQKFYENYRRMIREKAVHRYAVIDKSINCTGNIVLNSKNAKNVFDIERAEDVSFAAMSPDTKDCMDVYHVGLKTELVYNSHAIVRSSNLIACNLSYDNTFAYYCDSCHNSQNLFGCVALKKSSYCILNKQYSKEEYDTLVPKIIEHMKKTGEWGEFFPPKYSPVCYNETQGAIYMSMKKEEVLARGFKWADDLGGTFGKETIKEISDSIKDTDESICKEVLACDKCNKNYNIALAEYELYKKMIVPIPEFCPDCRYLERQTLRNPRRLWHRVCICDKQNHSHKDKKCIIEFETPYAPERPEKVYCEECYKKEVY